MLAWRSSWSFHFYLSTSQLRVYCQVGLYISPHSTTLTISFGLHRQPNPTSTINRGIERRTWYTPPWSPVTDPPRPRGPVSDRDSPIISPCRYIFNFPNYQHPLNHPSKNTVFTIEEFGWGACDEELGISESWFTRRGGGGDRRFSRLVG